MIGVCVMRPRAAQRRTPRRYRPDRVGGAFGACRR